MGVWAPLLPTEMINKRLKEKDYRSPLDGGNRNRTPAGLPLHEINQSTPPVKSLLFLGLSFALSLAAAR
jgi:hypothetical protein